METPQDRFLEELEAQANSAKLITLKDAHAANVGQIHLQDPESWQILTTVRYNFQYGSCSLKVQDPNSAGPWRSRAYHWQRQPNAGPDLKELIRATVAHAVERKKS